MVVALLGARAGRIGGLAIVLGLYDDTPARGNSVLRGAEFVGFEEESGEYGSDADELPVGQSDDLGRGHRTETVCLSLDGRGRGCQRFAKQDERQLGCVGRLYSQEERRTLDGLNVLR